MPATPEYPAHAIEARRLLFAIDPARAAAMVAAMCDDAATRRLVVDGADVRIIGYARAVIDRRRESPWAWPAAVVSVDAGSGPVYVVIAPPWPGGHGWLVRRRWSATPPGLESEYLPAPPTLPVAHAPAP